MRPEPEIVREVHANGTVGRTAEDARSMVAVAALVFGWCAVAALCEWWNAAAAVGQ